MGRDREKRDEYLDKKERRSRSRSRDRHSRRDHTPKGDRRSASRSIEAKRSRYRPRDRHSRSRSRDRRPRKHHRSRSSSRHAKGSSKERCDRENSHGCSDEAKRPLGSSKAIETPKKEDTAADVDEETAMLRLLGFAGFQSTKGAHVVGSDAYAANIQKMPKYRQYMNRNQGINRPLSE